MRKLFVLSFVLLMIFQSVQGQEKEINETKVFVFNPSIERLRELAKIIPGEFPLSLNIEKIAETIRPASVVIKGGDPNKSMTLSRTVYQAKYIDGTVMLDSGMDIETHKTFGKTEEPYFPEKLATIKKALDQANLIILTHYHADHVGGVIRSSNFEELAKKTWITESTANLLINRPHKPIIAITENQVNKFIISKDQEYMPIAPGIVLFMAPGHTPDSKMIYIKLSNGQEYIHSVDSGWSIENINNNKMKNASWVHEDEKQLAIQYKWLNKITRQEKDIIILCSHDDHQYNELIENRLLGKGMKVENKN